MILNNVPSLSYITFKDCIITYQGTPYPILNCYTNKMYVYWDLERPNELTFSNERLTEKVGRYYIAWNDKGTHVMVPQSELELSFEGVNNQDLITDRVLGFQSDLEENERKIATVEVDVNGIKTQVGQFENDIQNVNQTMSEIKQTNDEVVAQVETISKEFKATEELRQLKEEISLALLDTQSILGEFFSEMNSIMKDSVLSDEEKASLNSYKSMLTNSKGVLIDQIDEVIAYLQSENLEEEAIKLTTQRNIMSSSIDNLINNIDAVCTDDKFTTTEMTTVVTYFSKANDEINKTNNLIDDYIFLQSNGKIIEELSKLTIAQDEIKQSVSKTETKINDINKELENIEIAVKNVDVMYYLSTSPSSLEGGSWSTNSPTWVDGKYIWSKTVTTYTNGTNVESSPTCITPSITGAKLLNLIANRIVVAYDSEGKIKDSSDIVLEAEIQNSIEQIIWTTTPQVTLSGEGNVRNLNPKNFDNHDSITIKATIGEMSDSVTIVKIKDGVIGKDGENGEDGIDGKDAYTIVLTNESHTFPGDVSNALNSNTFTDILAYKGIVQMDVSIGNISNLPTGMNVSILNNNSKNVRINFSVTTSMVSPNGTIEIPLTIDGISFIKMFTYSISFKGQQGLQGLQGEQGEQGIPGTDGVTTYTWIKYADDSVGSGLSNDPTNKTYIGFAYNKTTQSESTNPKDYVWSLIKGKDGIDGLNGKDGKDGTSVTILGTYNSFDELVQAHPSNNANGDGYIIQGNLYVWDGNQFQDVGKISGEDGKSAYLHIKYSNDNGINFTPSNGEEIGDYIGIYTDDLEEDSLSPSKYTWKKIKGEDGIDGEKGKDGKTYYTWIKYSDSSDGSNLYDTPNSQTKYIGIATNKEVSTESSNKNDYIWSKFRGEDGTDGVDGKDGTDGKTTYFHIKYSSVPNPTTSSQISETPNIYIGTYVDYIEKDSTNPSDYKWSRFQGEQGEKGIPGENGTNGETYYLHIKYSNDGGTTFTSNNGEQEGTYIGVYTDNVEDDSLNANDYKWSKIVGKDIESITEEYYLSTSKTTQVDGLWVTSPPLWENGKYLWTRSKIVYKNPTKIEYTTPVCDSSWDAINDLKPQIDENKTEIKTIKNTVAEHTTSLESITSRVSTTETKISNVENSLDTSIADVKTVYYLSTSDSDLVGGSWTTEPPSNLGDNYLWSKDIVTRVNGTTKETNPVRLSMRGKDGESGYTIILSDEIFIVQCDINGNPL